MTSVLSKCLKV